MELDRTALHPIQPLLVHGSLADTRDRQAPARLHGHPRAKYIAHIRAHVDLQQVAHLHRVQEFLAVQALTNPLGQCVGLAMCLGQIPD